MTWVTAADVKARWVGEPTPPSDDVIDVWVADAEVLVRAAFPDIDERIDEDPALLPRVELVVSRMVIRALKNPNALRSTTQQAGPFSVTSTVGGDDPGGLWLSDDDRDLLSSTAVGGQRAFTIDPTPVGAYKPSGFNPVDPDA